MLNLIDTHTHLTASDFDGDRDAVLERARAAGVRRLISIGSGYGMKSAGDAVTLAEMHRHIWATVGLHPNDAGLEFEPAFLRPLAGHRKVVAGGETGLDFYWKNAAPEQQERWFRAQIELALEFHKPLVIHARNAGQRCLEVLSEMGAAQVGGVFHCFAEDAQFAAKLAQLNFLVSVPGNLTFKKADGLRAVIQAIPLEQLMLETDAPFLAPQAYRGKRCESAFMLETAGKLAELKGIELEEVAGITTRNAERLFKLEPMEESHA
jgi:TatD DNase family protein